MGKCFLHGNGGGSKGVELNFCVVGSTSEPVKPTENTIWINTDKEITGWAFCATEPSEPFNGMVWIATGSNDKASFNALKNHCVRVNPLSAKQHVDGVWLPVDSAISQNGTWVELLNGELYIYGNECAGVTGGWDQVGSLASFTLNAANIDFSYTYDGGLANLHTNKPIDLTPFSKLNVLLDLTISGGLETYTGIGIMNTKPTTAYDVSYTAYKGTVVTSTQQILTLDISAFVGEYYVGFGFVISKGIIYKIWLE